MYAEEHDGRACTHVWAGSAREVGSIEHEVSPTSLDFSPLPSSLISSSNQRVLLPFISARSSDLPLVHLSFYCNRLIDL